MLSSFFLANGNIIVEKCRPILKGLHFILLANDFMSSLLPLTPSYRALAKLTRLRIHVSYLLTSVLPHLELREIGYDSEQVDGILYTVLEANHILD